ncbi:uncharacterized protein LOC127136806 [Lathyrus oleraceus]|uniref:uncharacterized protein LOC127136806 n=1 Tax=Pisum sativum TaxID=3888 RepID=UPI0021D3A5F2|nr:uncharacterized protein LOC127136806 [Pisum sativum]
MVHQDVFPKYVMSLDVKDVVVKAVDLRNQFENEQEFEFRDHILRWIRIEAYNMRFGMVIGRFNNYLDKRYAFAIMTCGRSEKYKPPFQNFKRDDTGSRKCECPFKLRGYVLTNKKLRFNVTFALHNHDLCKKFVGHPIVYHLMPKEKECVSNMTLNLIQSKIILATLKRKRLKNISNIKQVYRTCEDGVTVRDIFWTHPDSIKLFNTFPTTFIIDSKYKTNKYRLPLFEMVGISSIEKTYHVGYHITKNVRSQVKHAVETKQIKSEDGKIVKAGWKVCEKYPNLLKYVESIILDQVKEKIVCVWTDQVRHLGNTTTNQVESAHATLKNWLENSKGDLCSD